MRPVMSFSATCVWFFLVAISAPDAVCGQLFDTTGKPLRSGVPYYIIPGKPDIRGPLVPTTRASNSTKVLCPLDVAQAHPLGLGWPVYFHYFSRVASVQSNENIRIEFGPGEWPCTLSKMWRVRYSPVSKQTFISTGGASNQPNSQFRIRVEGDAYKIVHASNSSTYVNVGVLTDDFGVPRLILSDKPLVVNFQRIRQTSHLSEKTMLRMFPFY